MGYISQLLSGKSRQANEFWGTLGFVLVGLSALTSVNIAGQATSAIVILVGFFAFSVALGWLYYLLSAQEKPHLNPAVTVMSLFRGEVNFKTAVLMIVMQLIAALLASVLVALFYGSAGVEARLGAPYPSTAMGIPAAMLAELLGSLLFLGGVAYATFGKPSSRSESALLIGLSFGIGYLASAGVSGGALNPARALAPQLAAADLTGWWIYWVSPLIAATAIGLASRKLAGRPISKAQQTTPAVKAAPSHSPATSQTVMTEEDEREAEQRALQEKAREAIAKLKEDNPESRPLPKSIPTPTFYETESSPAESAPEGESGVKNSPNQSAEPEEMPTSKKPDVKFVKFEADEELNK